MRAAGILLLTLLTSCTTSAQRATAPTPPPRVLALVNGTPLTLDDLSPALLDAAGASILREHVLNQMLSARCQAASIVITPALLDAERLALVQTAGPIDDPAQARALTDRLARERGLSDARLTTLLRQNAMLRALVAPTVDVPHSAVAALHKVRHGPRMQASVIVVSSANRAAELFAQLRDADDAAFHAAARQHSIDASATTAGALAPISPTDSGVPLALRQALGTLTPGQTAGPILLPDGYAIARLTSLIPPTGTTLAQAREPLTRELRARLERQAMDQLAMELLDQAQVTPIDPALGRAWQTR